ncbi:MAG: phage tail tape measure protein [Rhodospirillales bacterium]|nr:phage tail tape measure protein [Rhodospirillales bacterium]
MRSSLDDASSMVSRAGQSIGAVGGSMTAKVTLPLVGIGTAAVVMGNQFNSGMANVISLAPEAADQIAGMSSGVQDLAVEMGASTSDMTGGLYQVVSAFGLAGESLDLLETNAMAATAGLATTEEAIALTSAVTKGYGDTTAEAVQHAADLALKTVQMGQTKFPELAASIGAVTPLAAALGVTQEELFGTMATATGVTGNAAAVSTQFRGVLQSLMSPTDAMSGLLSEMGFASGEAMMQQLGLQGTIDTITAAATASGQPLQAYIGSIEGQTLAMALAGPQADTFGQKLAEMQNAAGTTQAAFDAQTQGINAPKTQGIILAVVGLAAALGPVLMVLGPIVSGIGAVGAVIGALASPIGIIIAAVGLLAAAWVTDFGGIRTMVTEFWNTHLKPIFDMLVQWLQTNIPIAIGVLAGFWENTLKPALETVWLFIQENIFPIFVTVVQCRRIFPLPSACWLGSGKTH